MTTAVKQLLAVRQLHKTHHTSTLLLNDAVVMTFIGLGQNNATRHTHLLLWTPLLLLNFGAHVDCTKMSLKGFSGSRTKPLSGNSSMNKLEVFFLIANTGICLSLQIYI